MADTNTINRIGGILKNVYNDVIVEQQNLSAVLRKKFTKARGVRLGGDHYEVAVRVGGNRAGVGARLSDDALPTPQRQQTKRFSIYDRAEFGVIKVYDKDLQNTKGNEQAFISHLDDEVTQIAKDILKDMNIATYMDGTGILGMVNGSVAASTTFVAKTGTAFGNFGGRYMQVGDVIDIYDPTLTTQRGGASRTITAYDSSTQTVTLDAAVTLTANDIIVRGGSVNKHYVGLWSATDNASATFQGLSRATYPLLKGNVLAAGGTALSETQLQQIMSKVGMASGEQPNMLVVSYAQWDAYVSLGQSLKRYVNTQKLDRGFQELDYNGVPFILDPDCPPAAVMALNDQYVQNGVVTPLSWSEEDGSILKWNNGFAAYTAFMREYGNYVYPRPNALGRIEALQVNTAYVI